MKLSRASGTWQSNVHVQADENNEQEADDAAQSLDSPVIPGHSVVSSGAQLVKISYGQLTAAKSEEEHCSRSREGAPALLAAEQDAVTKKRPQAQRSDLV